MLGQLAHFDRIIGVRAWRGFWRAELSPVVADCHPEPKPLSQVYDCLADMGKLMMSVGGLFIPEAKESVEMMYEFEKPFIIDSSKFEKAFGMKATPIREAIKETVAWYKSHPQKK